MTTIASLKTPRGVYVAWDSCVSWGNLEEPAADPKVWRIPGALVGVAGSSGVSDVVRYAKITRPGKDVRKWAATTFCRAVRQGLADAGLKAKGLEILIAARGEIVTVDSDWGVTIPGRPYFAVGSGSAGVLCALHALLASRKPSKAVLLTAVDATCAHLSGVMPPVYCEVAP